jgi:hypothetical protein
MAVAATCPKREWTGPMTSHNSGLLPGHLHRYPLGWRPDCFQVVNYSRARGGELKRWSHPPGPGGSTVEGNIMNTKALQMSQAAVVFRPQQGRLAQPVLTLPITAARTIVATDGSGTTKPL